MKTAIQAKEPTGQLVLLSEEINTQAENCFRQYRTTLEHARDVGKLLSDAKSLVHHGKWRTWVQDNLTFSIDTAERMMKLHREWDKLKTAPVPIFGIKDAVAYLAAENKKTKSSQITAGRSDKPVSITAATEDEEGVDEPCSILDCYVDPTEADFFHPEQPLDEDAVEDLEEMLDNLEQSLTTMLDHDAISALSEFDPLTAALIRLQRALCEVSAGLARKRPVAYTD